MSVFQQRLKELRENSGLSQKKLAELLSTTNSSVCDWERGRAEPNIATIIFLADYFGVTCDYLLGRTDY